MTTRRCYVLWFPTELLCELLGNWRNAAFLSLPVLERCADCNGTPVDLPSDYVCEDATFDWRRKSIGLLISHPSFPECPAGQEMPGLYYREVTIQAIRVVGKEFDPDSPDPIIVERA